MGLFQWLPLANGGRRQETAVDGGRRRERFGLARRHKLKAKRSRRLPPSTAVSKWEPLEQTQCLYLLA